MFQIRIGPVTGSTEASTFPGHHELERRTCYDDHKEAEACAAPAAPSARNEREDGPDRFPKNWEQGFGSMYVVPRASRACDASVLERSFSWLADPFLCGRKVWDRPPCSSPVMTKPCLSSVDPWAVWYISHWSKHKSLINNPALIDSLKEKKNDETSSLNWGPGYWVCTCPRASRTSPYILFLRGQSVEPDHVRMKRSKGLVWCQHQGFKKRKHCLTEEFLFDNQWYHWPDVINTLYL